MSCSNYLPIGQRPLPSLLIETNYICSDNLLFISAWAIATNALSFLIGYLPIASSTCKGWLAHNIPILVACFITVKYSRFSPWENFTFPSFFKYARFSLWPSERNFPWSSGTHCQTWRSMVRIILATDAFTYCVLYELFITILLFRITIDATLFSSIVAFSGLLYLQREPLDPIVSRLFTNHASSMPIKN